MWNLPDAEGGGGTPGPGGGGGGAGAGGGGGPDEGVGPGEGGGGGALALGRLGEGEWGALGLGLLLRIVVTLFCWSALNSCGLIPSKVIYLKDIDNKIVRILRVHPLWWVRAGIFRL